MKIERSHVGICRGDFVPATCPLVWADLYGLIETDAVKRIEIFPVEEIWTAASLTAQQMCELL